ncbi:hypothetical protein [Solibacillus sp. FSL H8-0538]|uniref:hypothetical protein n=1 Tax=Solibacillus sp. FSL H8-0538 TaxID=2921400 RepID=UPI0030F55FFE
MKINEIGTKLFNQASLAYKKPIHIKIEGPIQEQQIIASLENNEQVAKKGDYIVTGVQGEQYPIGPEVFADYDKVDGENVYCKKKKMVHVYKVDFKGEVETTQGSTLYFQPGYYIVMESPTDMWAVAGDIFETTYEIV